MRVRQLLPLAGLVAGAVLVVAPRPAGATVAVSSAGTTITVSLAGYEPDVSFRCAGGNVAVSNGTTTFTPATAVSCAALTQVNLTGNSDSQYVDASGLNAAAFAAKPKLNAGMGDGHDELTETQNADTIDMGGGSDQLFLRPGITENLLLQMGSGTLDNATLTGNDAEEDLTVSSTGANTTFARDIEGQPAFVWAVQNVEYVDLDGGKGGDSLDASGLTAASAIVLADLDGDTGNDALKGGSRATRMNGGTGTNMFTLGTSADEVETESDTDIITGTGDNADDQVRDEYSLRSGGRTITGFANSSGTPTDSFYTGSFGNDLVVRVRPGTLGTALVTLSLDRMGQQPLPAGFEDIHVRMNGMSPVTPRTLADVVVPAQDVTISSTTGGRELIDLTVPSGSWTDTAASGNRTIATSAAGVGNVELPDDATYKVHGPWTNANQGFSHRVHRDLLMRFATDAQRDAVAASLSNGSKTRTQVVASIVNTDEYRGVDVDRVFLRYLRRHADSGGKTYWVGSLRNGKSLRQFRAQLFGSNEYFTKAGGTNATFVERAYEDVLGRKPDPSGLAYWTNKANNGTERGLIARQFLSSSEAKRTIVRDQFLRFLDRQPSADEIASWTSALDTANGEQALVSSLAASAGYFNRT